MKESLNGPSTVSQKGKRKVDDVPYMLDLCASLDGESSVSKQYSLDEEFGILALRNPGIDPRPCKFGRHRAPI